MAKVTVTSGTSAKIAGSGIVQTGLLKNNTGTATVYLEVNDAAGSTSGYPWAPGDGPIGFELAPGDGPIGFELRPARS